MKHNRGLSKPSFSPDPSQIRLVCGTEDQSKLLRSKVNRLIFTSIDENKSLDVWIYPVTDYIRDIDWFEISYVFLSFFIFFSVNYFYFWSLFIYSYYLFIF